MRFRRNYEISDDCIAMRLKNCLDDMHTIGGTLVT